MLHSRQHPQYVALSAAYSDIEEVLNSTLIDWDTTCLFNYLQGKVWSLMEVIAVHRVGLDDSLIDPLIADVAEAISLRDPAAEVV